MAQQANTPQYIRPHTLFSELRTVRDVLAIVVGGNR